MYQQPYQPQPWDWQPSPPPPPPLPPQLPKQNIWPLVAILLALFLLLAVGAVAYLLGTRQQQTPVVVTIATSTPVPTLAATATATPGQQVTTGKHITAIHTGTGFNENTGAVEGEKSIFSTGETVWIVYTVTNPDKGATAVLKLYNNGTYESSSDPVDLDPVTNTYANSVNVEQTGTHEVVIYYNGSPEASITFDVI